MDSKTGPGNDSKQIKPKPKKILLKLLSSLLSILLVFILLEAVFQIWLNKFANERSFLKYASLRQLEKRYSNVGRKWSLHRYLGHYPTPLYHKGQDKHNSLGYRSDEITIPKAEGIVRIVCMGGSTTYTTEVKDYKLSYPALLEKELKEQGYNNVEVINAGVGAWTSWESLVNFEFRILDLEPDVIIIYHGVNDILSRIVWPPKAYKGDNSGNSAPVTISMPSILEYSGLIRYFMIRFGLVKSHSSIDRHFSRNPATSYAIEFNSQIRRGIYPEGIFKETSVKEMLAANKPKYFKRNIENIIFIAKHRGIKTVLATFAYSPFFEEVATASSEEYISAYAEMNQVLKEISSEMNVNLFDFASVFPTDKRYYEEGVHVNAEGARLKAKLFADYLIESGLVEK